MYSKHESIYTVAADTVARTHEISTTRESP